MLASVDEISGAKRKENLVKHADDARMSKQLATLQYDIETGVDLAAAMESEPDRGALREFMREFELRAVLERLEEALPEGEAVPGRSVETELEVEVEEGTPGRPRRGPGGAGDRRRALGGGRRRADPRRLQRRQDELAVALAGRGLLAHDAKSLGGGRHGLLAAAAREGVELGLDHDTMIAAYLLEPQRRTYELTELAADAGIGLAEGAAAPGDERRRPALPSARRSRPGSTRPRRRAWSPPWPRSSARASRSWGWSRCCARSSCRWSTCWRRWNARA